MNGIDTTGTFTQNAFTYTPMSGLVAPPSHQARGLSEINAYGSQTIQSLQNLLGLAASNPAQAQADAQAFYNTLSNPAYVYQAQHGKDAAALSNFKTQALSLLQQIQAAAAAVVQTPTANPDEVPANPPGTTTVDSPTTLNALWLATFGKLLGGGVPAGNEAGMDTWQQIPVNSENSSTTGTLPVALIAIFLLLGVGAYWYFNK